MAQVICRTPDVGTDRVADQRLVVLLQAGLEERLDRRLNARHDRLNMARLPFRPHQLLERRQDRAAPRMPEHDDERRPEALFWRGEPVENFELQLSFRIDAGNSGIYYRASRLAGHEIGGYQFEIFTDKTGILLETGSDRLRREPSRRGTVVTATVVDNKDKLTVERTLPGVRGLRTNDWNEAVIVVRGNHIKHQLNGRTIIETIDEFEKRPRTGLVGFEVYGAQPTTVRFRNIRLKRLPAGD